MYIMIITSTIGESIIVPSIYLFFEINFCSNNHHVNLLYSEISKIQEEMDF